MELNQPQKTDSFINGQLSPEVFREIQDLYIKNDGVHLVYSDIEGNLLYGLPDCDFFPCELSCRNSRKDAIYKAISAGSPQALVCRCNYLLLAIPVMLNSVVLGGLIIAGDKNHSRLEEDQTNQLLDKLLSIVEQYNITNDAFMKDRRTLMNSHEKQSVITIIDTERDEDTWSEVRNNFIDALKIGDYEKLKPIIDSTFPDHVFEKKMTRSIKTKLLDVYTILVSSYGSRSIDNSLNKIHYLAVNAIIVEENPRKLRLVFIKYFNEIFEFIKERIHDHEDSDLSRILNYLESNLDEHLNRESVAKAVGMSVSKLSHLLTKKQGKSFPEILNGYRADNAALLLINTDKSIAEISAQCGFTDQSYFNKVFAKYYDSSPLQYRTSHKN